jgi:dihydroflavonol-4-reductase
VVVVTMRAVVLGATGHIGSHIVRALLEEGHEVRAAYRREAFLGVREGLPVERVRVDLDTGEGLEGAVQGCEWVFHAAGYYPRGCARREEAVAHAQAVTRRVFERMRQAAPSRVIFTSSAATIRRIPGRFVDERDTESWPVDGWRPLYATVKIAMEHEALQAVAEGLPVVVVNPSVCIGEGDAHAFSGQLVLAFAKRRCPFYADMRFNAVDTRDVGRVHVCAAARGRVGERYLATGREISLQAFGALTAQAAGVPAPRWRLPQGVLRGVAALSEVMAWPTGREPPLSRRVVREIWRVQALSGRKAAEELGVTPGPVEEAIRRAVAWFRANGRC